MGFSTVPCNEFVEVLASKAPVPGGGGASALVGAIGTALGNMVGSLTVGKKKYAEVEEEMWELKGKCDQLQKDFLRLIERDAEVFEPLSKAYGMPRETEEEKAKKAAEAKAMEQEDQKRADRIQGNQCLTAEDKEYLKHYKESLKKTEETTQRLEEFLPLAADLAAEMFRDGMNLADLIQEANVALLNIFAGDMEGVTDSDIRDRLRKGVKEAANQQDEQKFEDDCLVAKVQNLDNVMKDLTDGDEGEPKFSVEELAIMLDMDIDEMKDIIRLTGSM